MSIFLYFIDIKACDVDVIDKPKTVRKSKTHEIIYTPPVGEDVIRSLLGNCRISDLVTRDIAKRQTASVYLKQLCEIDVLTEKTAGKKLFINLKLITLMKQDSNDFARHP